MPHLGGGSDLPARQGLYLHLPAKIGQQPWSNGNSQDVSRVDYEPVGMVSAAPMSGDWFHQHFGISAEPLRLTAWFGPYKPGRNMERGVPGEKVIDYGAIDLRDGGTAIPYDEEDRYICAEYEGTLRKQGAVSRMEKGLYERDQS